MVATACYDIEHVRLDGYDVVVNKPRTQDYRAPSAPAAAFAMEQLVDEIAQKLNMDPLQLRLMNAYRDGDMKAHRKVASGTALIEVIQKAAEMVGHELGAEYRSMSSTEAR
jgi:CO/xanthine dehydrogenase Mo-binding subunit